MDPDAVYQKALAHPEGVGDLDELELLVYAVKELETYVAMQGWDGFFVGSCSYLYQDVRRCLELVRDSRSLAIVDSYVAHLSSIGIPFEPDAIDEWSREASDRDRALRPDWGTLFQAAADERWERIRHYLRSRDVDLVESLVASSTNDKVAAFAAELTELIESGPTNSKSKTN